MMNDADEIEADVKAGRLQLLEWGGDLLTVVRSEGSEIVICCAVGRNLKRWMPAIYSHAQRNGYSSIRFHSRPALQRMAADYRPVLIGYDDSLNVYRIEVTHGR